MLKRFAVTTAVAAMCAGVAVQAQSPPSPAGQPTQSPADQDRSQPTAAATESGSTTLTGCVYQEKDIPGRSPNVAERAGVLEDYILADVKMKGSESTSSAAASTSSVAGRMFKLEKVSDDRLREFVGKRVEVTGSIDAEAGDSRGATPQSDQSVGPDQVELAEFEVMSIKAASGGDECPASPGAE